MKKYSTIVKLALAVTVVAAATKVEPLIWLVGF